MAKLNVPKAVQHIEDAGMLLVYPIHNRKEPASLWSRFFPRSQMKWEWDESGDSRVAELWHLREQLSRSGLVVYSKWYRGRATFFSRKLFTALLSLTEGDAGLSAHASEILQLLREDSPLSTKEIKASADLRGRSFEPIYQKAMKELWNKFLVVGYGEKDDGAFPSLAVGATEVLFEDLWNDSRSMAKDDASDIITRKIPAPYCAHRRRPLSAQSSD